MMDGKVYYSINAEGVVTWISKNIADLSGWKPEEVINGHFSKFIISDDHEEIERKRANRKSGVIDEYRTFILHKDGQYEPIRIMVLQTPENSVGTIDRRMEERRVVRDE